MAWGWNTTIKERRRETIRELSRNQLHILSAVSCSPAKVNNGPDTHTHTQVCRLYKRENGHWDSLDTRKKRVWPIVDISLRSTDILVSIPRVRLLIRLSINQRAKYRLRDILLRYNGFKSLDLTWLTYCSMIEWHRSSFTLTPPPNMSIHRQMNIWYSNFHMQFAGKIQSKQTVATDVKHTR